jgi:predicted phosphodiesterase
MRVACLFDIHGNLPALEAVMDDVRRSEVDHIVIGGDVIPGPMPRECLDVLLALSIPASFIIGNGDRETAVAARGPVSSIIPEYFREAMQWNAAELRPRDLEIIDGWPLTTQLTLDGIGEMLFCHATPRNDTEIFLKTTSDEKLRPIFDSLGVPLVVCGHTHMQFDRIVGSTRIINAGSVGMPFQEAGAYWALLGPGVTLRRTAYDLDRAAARVRATGYPQAAQFAGGILTPPTEQSMIEAFATAELSLGPTSQ